MYGIWGVQPLDAPPFFLATKRGRDGFFFTRKRGDDMIPCVGHEIFHGEEEMCHGDLNRWVERVGSALLQIGLMNLGQTLTNSWIQS